MAERELDRIHIRDLLVRCIVGIFDIMREQKSEGN
jgi:hypothetical protein